ncbi:MAG: tetrahydrofolate dehydrogenase/cyclohydrolase catalytic domain-containing protein, partial [Candidatus Carbobacillus sp.]|nr:tetrahydrofolate dehydrogenase/cyclohydrolase catalytic domain-containing protein [Candidatus Carbobacillus sp.]
MQAQLMDGRRLAQLYRKKIKEDVLELAQTGISPRLVVVLIGSDPASLTYVRNKVKAAQDVAMRSEVLTLPETVQEETLLRTIEQLSADDDVDGILVQLPLPRGLDKNKVIERIAPEKDVDGFTYQNVGRAVLGKDDALYPCTPQGILALLDAYNVPLLGAEAVVVGRSDIVGKPVAQLLLY